MQNRVFCKALSPGFAAEIVFNERTANRNIQCELAICETWAIHGAKVQLFLTNWIFSVMSIRRVNFFQDKMLMLLLEF